MTGPSPRSSRCTRHDKAMLSRQQRPPRHPRMAAAREQRGGGRTGQQHAAHAQAQQRAAHRRHRGRRAARQPQRRHRPKVDADRPEVFRARCGRLPAAHPIRVERRLRRAGGRAGGVHRERPHRRELLPPLRRAPGLPYPIRRRTPGRPGRACAGRRPRTLRSGRARQLGLCTRGVSRAGALRGRLRRGLRRRVRRPGPRRVQQGGRGLPEPSQPRAGRPVPRRRRHQRAEAVEQARRGRQRARQVVSFLLRRAHLAGAAAACVAPACARPCASRPHPAAGMVLRCCSCDGLINVTIAIMITITVPLAIKAAKEHMKHRSMRNKSTQQASEDAGRRGRAWRGGGVAQQQQRRGRQPQPARAPARPARREEWPEPVLYVRPADAAWPPRMRSHAGKGECTPARMSSAVSVHCCSP
jgi:hypothetical protein